MSFAADMNTFTNLFLEPTNHRAAFHSRHRAGDCGQRKKRWSDTVLVLDGHDGVGKITLASRLAKVLGIAYVRPFGGAAGERMLRSAKQGDYAQTSILAKSAVEHVIESTDASVLVFDRHWMTVFTLIPEFYWQDWFPYPRRHYVGSIWKPPSTDLASGGRNSMICRTINTIFVAMPSWAIASTVTYSGPIKCQSRRPSII